MKFEITDVDDIRDEMQKVYSLQNWYSLKRDKKAEDHIWDEDKTVKENRQMTAAYNAAIDAEIRNHIDTYNQAAVELDNAIADFIFDELSYDDVKCSKEQAKYIWKFCKQEWEDDPHNHVRDLINFCGNFMCL